MKFRINKKITVKKAAKERLNSLSRSLAAFVLLFSLIFSPFNSAFSSVADNESAGFLNFKTGLNATAFFVFKTINSWFQISDFDSEQKKLQADNLFLQSQTETVAEGGRAAPALPFTPAASSAAETQISAGQKLIKKIAQLSPPALLPQALTVQTAGISQEELARELNILENSLKAEIYRMASQLAPVAPAAQTPASNFQAIALSQRIDNLDQVTISNATISKSTFSGSTGTITDLTATDLTATDFTTANLSASNNSYFTALSQGSIPFIGASGLLSQDNTNLFWDDTNNRLGLGTITPNYTLDVSGDIRTSATLYASTTEITNLTITTASSTQLTVSDKSWLGTVLGGTWQGTSITDTYIDDDITLTNITQITNRAISDTSGTLLVGRGGTGLTTATAGYALIGLDADTLQATSSIFIKPDGNIGIGAIAPTSTLQVSGGDVHFQAANGAPGLFYDYANNRLGLGTTTPAQGLSVDGNIYITGALGVGVATTTAGTIETSGDVVIGGNLQVGGNATIIGDTSSDTLVINSTIKSNLIPDQNATRDLGSTAYYWDDVYADKLVANNISAASTTIAGTQSESFTINSNNSSSDAEDMDIIFFRGTVVPNALIAWKSDVEKFDFNQPVFIQNDSSTTTVITLDIKGAAGQTADLFRVISDSGDSYLTISATGKSAMTNASTTQLTVSDKSWLGTVLGGTWQGTIIGDDYITKTGDWSGTVSGSYTGFGNDFYTYFNATSTNALAEGASNLYWTADRFDTRFAATSTTGLSEGTNLYWTADRFASSLAGTTTDALAEGPANLYWTQNRWDQAMTATTTLPTITTLLNLINASTTQLTVSDKSWLGTVLGGTWQGTSITDTYIDDDITLTNITQITNRAISDTSGTLLVGRGGTGLTTLTSGSILYADGDDNLTALASSTDGYVLVLDANGRPSWNDFTGTGKVVYDTSPTFTTSITVPADSISHTELSEGDAFIWTGSHSFSGSGDIDLPNDSVDATDINFNYAASGSEGGSATSGDSASAFFSTGTIEHEYGGLQADVSSYAGLLSITGGATAQVDSVSELNALLLGESVASTTNVWADAYISSASAWNAKWDALSDIPLAHKSIFVGDSSGHPVATSTITVLDSGFVGIGTTTPQAGLDIQKPATGDYFNISNDLHGDIVTINDAGNVGIGTTTPNAKLEVYDGNVLFNGTGSNDFWFNSTNGNLGIGTTDPSWYRTEIHSDSTTVGGSKGNLMVFDTTSYAAGVGGGIIFGGKYNSAGSRSEWGNIRSVKENAAEETGAHMDFYTRDHGSDTAFRMRISADGNIGIGTTAPTSLLHVNKDTNAILEGVGIQNTNVGASARGRLSFFGATSVGDDTAQNKGFLEYLGPGHTTSIDSISLANTFLFASSEADAFWLYQDGNKPIHFFTNNQRRMTIEGDGDVFITDGNIGIGTTTPQAALDIQKPATGDYFNISNDLHGDIVTINDAGNIGIGTTGPDGSLHIFEASGITISPDSGFDDLVIENGGGEAGITIAGTTNTGIYFADDASDSIGRIYYSHTNDYLNFWTNSGSKMVITDDGNVGIGTMGPNDLLEINDDTNTAQVRIMGTGATTADLLLGGSSHTNPSVGVRHLSTGMGMGHLTFLTSATDGALTEQVRIQSDGNVGIGTTGPFGKLHIESGDSGVTSASSRSDEFVVEGNDDTGISIFSGTTGIGWIAFGDSGDNSIGNIVYDHGTDYLGTANTLGFGTSGRVNDMVIGPTGNVGIGTTAPDYKLEVAGGDVEIWDSSDLGSELVTNGGFDADSNWIKGTGWSIAGGVASSDGSQSAISNLYQTGVDLAGGERYLISFTISGYSAGEVWANIGGNTNTAHASADGTITEVVTAHLTTNDYVHMQADADFVGSVDDVTVKEVTGGDLVLRGIITGGGTSGLKILANGNVGIGTTEPGAKLSFVADTTAAGGINFGGDVNLYRSGANNLRTDDVIQAYGGIYTGKIYQSSTSNNVAVTLATTGMTITRNQADANSVLSVTQINAGSTGDILQLKNSGGTVVTVQNDGNVGIGTTGPDEKLHVKGGVCITDSDTCAGAPGDGDIWILGNMSAGSISDRTPIYEGDALSEIIKIKGKDGKIDHSTLPEFVRAEIEKPIFEKRNVEEEFFDEELNKTVLKLVEKDVRVGTSTVTERNLGNMISVNVRAIQQLAEKIGDKVFKGDVINYNAGQLALENDSGEPQMKIAFDAENFAELQVNAVGDLTLTTAGADLNLPNDNLSVCSGGACPAAARQMDGAGNLTVENTAFVAGALGVGTSSPDRVFNVFETAARPQMKISYDTDNYAELQVSAAGDLALSARGGDIRLPNENLAICSGGACPASAGLLTGAGNLTVENTVFVAGALGVGTARPGRALDVFETRTSPQMRISYDEDLYSELNVSATGDLIISARGGDVSILNENFKICSENGCPAEANLLNGAGNLVVENSILALGGIGINTASPSYTLDVNGTLRAYGITDASDIRLKTNIRDLGNFGERSFLEEELATGEVRPQGEISPTLSKIQNLRGVTFYWRNADLGTARQIGLIAQELEIEYPELVSTDNKGFKSIQYGKFTAVLLEAVKELFSMSRTIEYKSANLENRTADLEKQNKLLAAKTEKLEERLRVLEQILVQ